MDNVRPALHRLRGHHLHRELRLFRVRHHRPVHSVLQELRDKGARIESEPLLIPDGPNKGGLLVYLRDPDGVRIELIEPPARPA